MSKHGLFHKSAVDLTHELDLDHGAFAMSFVREPRNPQYNTIIFRQWAKCSDMHVAMA